MKDGQKFQVSEKCLAGFSFKNHLIISSSLRHFSYQIVPQGSDFKFHFVLVLVLENWGTKVQPSKTQCFAGEKKSLQPHSSSGFPAHFSVCAVSLLCEFGKWLNSYFKASSVLWLGSDLELLSGITDATTRCNFIVINLASSSVQGSLCWKGLPITLGKCLSFSEHARCQHVPSVLSVITAVAGAISSKPPASTWNAWSAVKSWKLTLCHRLHIAAHGTGNCRRSCTHAVTLLCSLSARHRPVGIVKQAAFLERMQILQQKETLLPLVADREICSCGAPEHSPSYRCLLSDQDLPQNMA